MLNQKITVYMKVNMLYGTNENKLCIQKLYSICIDKYVIVYMWSFFVISKSKVYEWKFESIKVKNSVMKYRIKTISLWV